MLLMVKDTLPNNQNKYKMFKGIAWNANKAAASILLAVPPISKAKIILDP
jgi:hypothetical protein